MNLQGATITMNKSIQRLSTTFPKPIFSSKMQNATTIKSMVDRVPVYTSWKDERKRILSLELSASIEISHTTKTQSADKDVAL